MGGFLTGLFVGAVLGVAVTLVLLVIAAGSLNLESAKQQTAPPYWKGFWIAAGLLAICTACFALQLEKSALIAFLLSIVVIARLGGSRQGIFAAIMAAILVAWFLPPGRTLRISGLDNRVAFGLFVIGTILTCILVGGERLIKKWIAMANPD